MHKGIFYAPYPVLWYLTTASWPTAPELAGRSCLDSALEATQGQMDGFFSQLPYKCHLEKVASVGD